MESKRILDTPENSDSDYEGHEVNALTAFLMAEVPANYTIPSRVCELDCFVYGLRQYRCWNKH